MRQLLGNICFLGVFQKYFRKHEIKEPHIRFKECFRKHEICGHLGLDPRSYACDMDIVDSAFERGDVGLFKPGIENVIGGKFITLRRKLFAGFCDFLEIQKK